MKTKRETKRRKPKAQTVFVVLKKNIKFFRKRSNKLLGIEATTSAKKRRRMGLLEVAAAAEAAEAAVAASSVAAHGLRRFHQAGVGGSFPGGREGAAAAILNSAQEISLFDESSRFARVLSPGTLEREWGMGVGAVKRGLNITWTWTSLKKHEFISCSNGI